MPPLEGEVPNEREAEGFVRHQSMKPLSQPVRAASSPFRGAKAAAPLREAKSHPYRYVESLKNGYEKAPPRLQQGFSW